MQTTEQATATLTAMLEAEAPVKVRGHLAQWERYGKSGYRGAEMIDVPAELGTSEELLANVNQLIGLWWTLKGTVKLAGRAKDTAELLSRTNTRTGVAQEGDQCRYCDDAPWYRLEVTEVLVDGEVTRRSVACSRCLIEKYL